MITFRQFLESSDPLLDVEHLMIIRKLIPGLTNADAQHVLDWLGTTADYDWLPDDVSSKIANSELAETDYVGQNLMGEPDHVCGPLVREKIWRMVGDAVQRGGMFKEERDVLSDLADQLQLARTYGIPRSDAVHLLHFVRQNGNAEFWNMSDDSCTKVLDQHRDTMDRSGTQPMLMDMLAQAIMAKAGLSHDMGDGFADL